MACAGAYDPRFLFAWAQRQVRGDGRRPAVGRAVHRGPAQPSLRAASRRSRRRGVMRAAVEGQIEAESLPLVLSGMLYDDG